MFDYYQVNEQLVVSVRNIDKVSTALDKGVAAGADVDGINFTIEKPNEHIEEALKRSYADVKKKAEAIVASIGMTLGKPIRVTDLQSSGINNPQPIYAKRASMMMAMDVNGGSESTVSAGEIKLTHNVEILYEVY